MYVWRSTNHWKGSWMVRQGLKKLDFRWGWLISIAGFYKFFREGISFSFIRDFAAIWGGLGRPKWMWKSKFERILAPFSEAETEKNLEKIVLRNMRFFDTNFLAFFWWILAILPGFWEAPGFQKIEKKTRKNWFSNAFSFEGGFWDGSGAVFGGFWKGFGWILMGF